MDNRFDKVIDIINKGSRFLVISHVNPEGDAVGSAIAMGLGLKKLGKYSKVFFNDNIPNVLKFLPGAEDIAHNIDSNEIYDAAIVVDCGQLNRVGNNFKTIQQKCKIINIDHHITNDMFGNINVVIPDASSTGEVVYDLLTLMDVPITKDIAVNLYTSILSDTGSFRYSSTTPHALAVASELLKAGVDPWNISQRLYESHPVKRFKLLGKVLNTLEVTEDGQIAVLVVTLDMLKDAGADKDITEGFVNFARAVEGVEVGILFRESKPGEYKMSFRSRGNINVAEIGGIFGGGGHKNAAGCNITGTLEEVKEKILSAAIEKIRNIQGV